jgi:hypothetical protein
MDSMYDVHHTALNASVAQLQNHTYTLRIGRFGVARHCAYNRHMTELDAFGQES